MKHDASYKEKLHHLREWMPSIIESVKKDLKNEHLKRDFAFQKQYFGGKNVHKIELEDLVTAYTEALKGENAEELAEFIANRWIFKHSDIYHLFEEYLRGVRADFTAIEELKENEAELLIQKAVKEFGYPKTYLFSILNAVAFSPKDFDALARKAKESADKEAVAEQKREEEKSLEGIKQAHALELARVTDRYEKKLIGMQKKYTQDVEVLKKQLGLLQKRLAGANS